MSLFLSLCRGGKTNTTATADSAVGPGGEDDKGGQVRKHPTFQRASELLADKVGGELPHGEGLREHDLPEAAKSVWDIIGEYERDRPRQRKREREELDRFNVDHPDEAEVKL